jgi:hypothetical protein
MSPIYVPGKVVLRQTWQPMDTDAAAYITAVETADGQALEEKTKIAIDNFVLGCKADGIWNAIKACCIMAGARTLAGALVPLVGPAPTNFNFVAGDYNRKTGLVGNGSTKYLNSNRNNNADPPANFHVAVNVVKTAQVNQTYIAGRNPANTAIGAKFVWNFGDDPYFTGCPDTNTTNQFGSLSTNVRTFQGMTRSSTSQFTARISGQSSTINQNSNNTAANVNLFVFAQSDNSTPANYSSARLAFYSIGESLNLALLDARVTDLINAFAAAIP